MTPDNNSEFNLAFEIRGGKKGNPTVRLRSWKVKLLVGFSAILTLIFLAMLFILELTNSTKILRSVKTKRFVKMDGRYGEPENTESVQNDIRIIPEGGLEDFARRANEHPNHRYVEIGPEGNTHRNVLKNLHDESGWPPEPFRLKKPKVKNLRSRFQNPKSLGDSTRFKGVFGYVSPEADSSKSLSTENFYHSQEINNLIQNYSENEGEENAEVKKAFKSHGAPFQVPVKDVPGRERLNVYLSLPSKSKQSWFKEQFRKKPLTIILDIYPMAEADKYFEKEGPKLNRVTKPSRNEFSKPRDIHSKGKFLFPRESRNGIIMKLNLYTKERRFSRRQNSMEEPEDEIHSSDRDRAEEKSFGWFFTKKDKNQEPKKCSLMALEPQGKRVTAKWKNKNGEWIHANHLSVKYLKK